MKNKLDQIFKNSKSIPMDKSSKIVIMSDCHRGIGDNLDNFIKNRNIYESALQYYYQKDFTYIELGDGDEMWEVKDYQEIVKVNLNVFKQLKKFYVANRLIMIYGNHDILKKSSATIEKYFAKYYDEASQKEESLLEDLIVYESLILNYKNYDIFLIHGHQVDFLNSTIWPVSRFLVRYLWGPLEKFFVKAPASVAKNHQVSEMVEKRLKEWSVQNNKILIAGHTHRAIFPKIGESLYFNDGSCIGTNGITCIEIENGSIALVLWELKSNQEDFISVKRKVLEKKTPITDFYK